MLSKIPGKSKACQADLQHDPIGHKLNDQALWTEDQQPVKGACQIVGVQGGKIHPHANIPAVEQTSPLA
jgi:hypothetical protein